MRDAATARAPESAPADGAEPEPPRPDPPEPPEGYREPTRFSYPSLLLFAGSFALLVASVAGFGALLAAFRGVTSFEFTFGPGGIAIVSALVIGTFVVHELVHGLVYRLLGYRVRYGIAVNVGAAYAAAFGQFQTRRDNLLVALAPLAVFTVVLVSLLAGPFRLALAAFLVLVVNTSGAVGDLYLAYRLVRLPEGTLLYDADLRHSYIYRPE